MKRSTGIKLGALAGFLGAVFAFTYPTIRRQSSQDLFLTAERYAKSGDYVRAEVEMKKSLEADPSYFAARDGLATIYSTTNRVEQAVGVYKEGIRMFPDDIRGYYELSQMLFSWKRFSESRDVMGKCVQLDPLESKYKYSIGLALEREDRLGEALEHWRKAAGAHPADAVIARGIKRVERMMALKNKKPASGKGEDEKHEL